MAHKPANIVLAVGYPAPVHDERHSPVTNLAIGRVTTIAKRMGTVAAESYRAHGHRVTTAAELLPLMQQCHSESGVHLIEVPVDYSENDRILNHEIQERSAEVGQ